MQGGTGKGFQGEGPNRGGGTKDNITLQSPAWCKVLRSICDESKVAWSRDFGNPRGEQRKKEVVVFTHRPLKCDPVPGQEGSCSVVMGQLCRVTASAAHGGGSAAIAYVL